MATSAVKNAFRRVRSDDDILVAEQQTKDTTAAVLVEILHGQSKKQGGHRHPHTAAPVPCDARPRSLDLDEEISKIAVAKSGFAANGPYQTTREKSAARVHGHGDEEVTVLRGQEDVTKCAKVIASRLQRLGDAYQQTISEETVKEMAAIIASPQPSPADSDRLRRLLSTILANLSLPRVFEVFVFLHQLIRELVDMFGNSLVASHSRHWELFQELMEQTILRVTSWICSNGGWATLIATIRSRGNSFIESPPPSPSAPTKTRSRVFSLSEDGELTPSCWETRSSCQLHSSPSQGNLVTAHDPQLDPGEEWCNIVIPPPATSVQVPSPTPVGQASAAIPVPYTHLTRGGDLPFDRFRSGSLPASRRERNGLSRTSQIALTAYSAVACCYLDN